MWLAIPYGIAWIRGLNREFDMLMQIKNLSVCVATPLGSKKLVEDITLDIGEQRIVGLVGGSGSGKTTTGLAILRLLASPVSVTAGAIRYRGEDLLSLPEERMRVLRGQDLAMVFQEPLNALNPVFTIGDQIAEVLEAHTSLTIREVNERVYELLANVEIPEPKRVAQSYPYQLSGGMRQRAMIAMAIALNPRMIIADEPTSNLDVTIQARIMDLFQKLQQEMKLSILLITHDLGLVRHLADDVAVMSAGKIVEFAPAARLLVSPQHEYTRQLLKVRI